MSFNKKISIIVAFTLGFWNTSFAQNEIDPIVIQIIDDLSDDLPEDFDFSELTERLQFYRKNPVEINKISQEQLQELFFLNQIQIHAFLDHRKESGKLISLLEMQTIDGFDLITIRRLINFVYLRLPNSLESLSFKNLYQQGTNDLMVRYSQYLQPQKGFITSSDKGIKTYTGTPQRILLRYRYYYGRNISASLNMEKDSGEPFLPGKSIGYDFSSVNIFVKNIGAVKKAVLGDYSLQFGQGLTLWTGLSFGKGALISNLAKPDLGLQPYKSTNEILFLRGVSATINFKQIEFTPFLSLRKIDASLNGAENQQEISSMSQSGLHRTINEVANKNAASQNVYGLNIKYVRRNINAGLTGYQTYFSNSVQAGQLLYNRFQFSGKRLTNVGLNYSYNLKNTYFFGEVAYSRSTIRSSAFINGLMSSISSNVSLVILHRHYPANYHSLFNQAVAEASNAVNENGLYAGVLLKLIARWDLAVYSDFFKFPWLKFGVDAPSSGHEIFGQLTFTPSKKTKYMLRYKLEQKQENDDLANIVNFIQDVVKQSYRLEFNTKFSKVLTLRNRFEVMNYKKENQKRELGWMAYQDLIYDPMKSKYSANMRFAYFNTPGFNSRIYAYENDVLYSYSVPAYQNQGIRFYLNGRYTLSKKLDAWMRYSISKYQNLDVIGSGAEQIQGSSRSEMKLQLRYQF